MKRKDIKIEYRNYAIIGGIVLLMVLICTRFVNVFGSNTDWVNQHTIFPEYFRMLFYKTGKILPNLAFNYGAGQNIFNLSYYGLLSPIILPSYLLPFMDMVTYMTITSIILVIGSGILFYRWIKGHGYNDNICLVASLILVLSTSFIFQLHRHVMFVNYMPFLIMALIGVDRYLKEKKKTLLIIGIFLMIMTCYYYSVGGLLVICIYYLHIYLDGHLKKGERFGWGLFFKEGFKFIGVLLVGILMAGALLLPTMYTLFAGRGESESSISLISLFIPYLKVHKIFSGTYAMGLTLLGFVSLLYLFFTKKKSNVIIGVVLSIILFIPIFRYILNGGLYLREKCFIPFMPLFGLYIAYFLNDLLKGKIEIRKFILYLLLVIVPIYLCNIKAYEFLYMIGFVIMLLLYDKYKKDGIVNYYVVVVAFLVGMFANLGEDYVSTDEYNEIFDGDTLGSINNILDMDKGYYRMNNLNESTTTINKIYNERYFTTNMYASTYNREYLDFVRNTFKTSMVEYNYFMVPASQNALFNMFMGVKYVSSPNDLGLGYTSMGNGIYRNDNAFPLMYLSNNLLNEKEFDSYGYPMQEELLLANVVVSGDSYNKNDSHIEKINLDYTLIENDGVEIVKNENGYTLKVNDKGRLKIKLGEALYNKILFINIDGLKENSCSYDNIKMSINGALNVLTCKSWIYANKNNTFRYVVLGDVISELNIELTRGTYNVTSSETYVLDYDDIKDLKRTKKEVEITSFESDKIVGKVTLDERAYFVTSIPYDEGFTVKVNGKEIAYEKVNKAFLGFPLNEGSYEVEITYHSPWLREGKMMSLVGFVIFGVMIVFDIIKRKKKEIK